MDEIIKQVGVVGALFIAGVVFSFVELIKGFVSDEKETWLIPIIAIVVGMLVGLGYFYLQASPAMTFAVVGGLIAMIVSGTFKAVKELIEKAKVD